MRHVLLLAFFVFTLVFFPSYGIQFVSVLILVLYSVSFAYRTITKRAILVRRETTILRAYRNQPVVVRFTVVNRSFLPVSYLFLSDAPSHLFASEPNQFLLELKPWEKRELSYTLYGRERGDFSVGPVLVKGTDPFGFFPWKIELNTILRVIIYPSVQDVTIPAFHGLPSGSLRVHNPLFEDVTQFRSIREYVPGDDPRRIAWKVSARLGSLHTMEFLPTLHYPALVLLNLDMEDYPLRLRYHYAEKAIETAASLVFFCLRQKQAVGFFSNGLVDGVEPSIPIRGGYEHGITLLEVLARIKTEKREAGWGESFFTARPNVPIGCRIFYIGPEPDASQLQYLSVFKGKNVSAEFLLINYNKIDPFVFKGMKNTFYRVKEGLDALDLQ